MAYCHVTGLQGDVAYCHVTERQGGVAYCHVTGRQLLEEGGLVEVHIRGCRSGEGFLSPLG